MLTNTFVTGGDAIFTVEVPPAFQATLNSKPHYTFRVRRSKPTPQFPTPALFVSLLAGPDNTRDYQYLGMLNDTTGEARVTGKSKFTPDSVPVRLLNRVLAKVWANDHAAFQAHGFQLHHEGKCGCCKRRLTTPESIERGIGPECWKKMGL